MYTCSKRRVYSCGGFNTTTPLEASLRECIGIVVFLFCFFEHSAVYYRQRLSRRGLCFRRSENTYRGGLHDKKRIGSRFRV